jgi:hypothetical protein
MILWLSIYAVVAVLFMCGLSAAVLDTLDEPGDDRPEHAKRWLRTWGAPTIFVLALLWPVWVGLMALCEVAWRVSCWHAGERP